MLPAVAPRWWTQQQLISLPNHQPNRQRCKTASLGFVIKNPRKINLNYPKVLRLTYYHRKTQKTSKTRPELLQKTQFPLAPPVSPRSKRERSGKRGASKGILASGLDGGTKETKSSMFQNTSRIQQIRIGN